MSTPIQCSHSSESDYLQQHYLQSLINNEDMSDICFLVGEVEKIYGHKLILSMSSPVFKKMFYGELAEKRSLIQIPDLTPTGFMNMIRCIYFQNMEFPVHELYETYVACDKYMVHDFDGKIYHYLCMYVSEGNRILAYDQLIKIDKIGILKDHEWLYSLRKSFDRPAFNNCYFNKISKSTLIELLVAGNLNVEEIYILKSCLNWVSASKSTIREKRSSFKSIKPYIDFSRITIDDLKDIDQIDSFLTKEEVADLFLYLTYPKSRAYPFELKTLRKQLDRQEMPRYSYLRS